MLFYDYFLVGIGDMFVIEINSQSVSKYLHSTGKARRETESVANFSQKVLKEFPCDKREVGESPRGTLKWNKNSILVQM